MLPPPVVAAPALGAIVFPQMKIDLALCDESAAHKNVTLKGTCKFSNIGCKAGSIGYFAG